MTVEKTIELQRVVFSKSLNRTQLMQYTQCDEGKRIQVQVFRNHSFELIEHTIAPFLYYAGIRASFIYGGYDDSFSFQDLVPDADILILWIDTTRYRQIDIESFIQNRIEQLRMNYSGEILVVPFGSVFHNLKPADAVYNLDDVERRLGERFTDLRVEKITGTKLSRMAMVEISRGLGLQYIPAMALPAIKAIAVDLDNTLYAGVLGEDGKDGVVLSDGHRQFQKKLKELAESGVFLCILSKNEERDVLDLFNERKDFPLSLDDFTKVMASWSPKAQSIEQVSRFLNIGLDSFLFIDDNIGEIASMYAAHPEVKLLLAEEDAVVSCDSVAAYPGLLRIKANKEDGLRKSDVQANEVRNRIRQSMSNEDFIRSLGLKLTFELDNHRQTYRISELANKTNQFIFNYQRYSETDIQNRMSDPDYSVISVSLSDNLSDSGLIGVLVGKKSDRTMGLEECFISCRALGRGIDDIIVLGAINLLMRQLKCEKLKVNFQKGPKNIPAENFLGKYLMAYCSESGDFSYEFPDDLLSINIGVCKGE